MRAAESSTISCYTTAVVLKSDYVRFSDSKGTGRARQRKLPVNARDLVIPHGRLTRNCVHYRRIRFGSLRTGDPVLGVCGRRILHDIEISIN